MQLVQYVAPTIEPIDLATLKLHLRLDSDTLAGNLSSSQSIAPGSHAVSAGGVYTHTGAAVDVLGKQAIVYLESGTNGAGGTVDVKLQDSDDNATWADVSSGAFTQVTEATDNATYEKAYAGTKQYLRVVGKVLVAACEFGVSIIVNAATTAEDSLLTSIITAARVNVEDITGRKLLTQTWDYYLDYWPSANYIKIPFGQLQDGGAVAPIVSWKDSDGVSDTLTVSTEYLVEQRGDYCGRIVLPYGVSWPAGTPWPSQAIKVRFVCGWTTAALVPKPIIQALLMICGDLYENRESQVVGNTVQTFYPNNTTQALLASWRLADEF